MSWRKTQCLPSAQSHYLLVNVTSMQLHHVKGQLYVPIGYLQFNAKAKVPALPPVWFAIPSAALYIFKGLRNNQYRPFRSGVLRNTWVCL